MNEIQSINLVNSIKRLVLGDDGGNNMIFGKVVSVDPLKIDIGNNIVLTKKFLYLGQMCRPFKVTIPHTHKYSGESEKSGASAVATGVTVKGDLSFAGQGSLSEINGHYHKIENQETDNVYNENQDVKDEDYDYVIAEIYPKLKKGDIVLMFAMNGNQMYYVAERLDPEA